MQNPAVMFNLKPAKNNCDLSSVIATIESSAGEHNISICRNLFKSSFAATFGLETRF